MSVKNLWFSMSGLLVVAASGCGDVALEDLDSSKPSESERSVGATGAYLTVLEADEVSGKLLATYGRNGREITFEMRLGGAMELPPDASEQNVPRMMIDARVLDQDGQPLYIQMAGDEFIDPTWDVPAIEGIDEALRKNDFEMIQASAAEFSTVDLPASFEDLRLNALQMARMMPELTTKTEASTYPIDSSRQLQANVVVGGASVEFWDYRIYRKAAFFGGSPFDHSAVQLRGWNWNKSSVVFTAISCNHGTCAGVAPMAVKCTMVGYVADDGTNSRYFFNEPSTTTAVTSGCSTEYSAVFDNGDHVCNDDTSLQIHAIKFDLPYNRAIGPTGECSDNVANYWAPNCI